MKKLVMLMMAIVILVVPMTAYAAFPDVPSDHWALEYIEELSEKEIINGYTDGNFGPSDTLTYGQFLKLITVASNDEIEFDLVETDIDHWAAPYLKVAEAYEAVENGKITKEMLDKPITRIEVTSILSKCDINMREHAQKSNGELSFNDIGNITVSQKILLSHAVANNIINGYSDGTFKPQNNLTRAEAAKILSVYMNIE